MYVCIYVLCIYIYMCVCAYIYIYTHTKPRNKSRAYVAFLKKLKMPTKPSKFHRILMPFGRNVDLDL